jgi:hypothetical protein
MEESAKVEGKQVHAKRHLRNLLIDKQFQLRWVFRVTVAVSIIVAVMGYFIYRTVADATDQMVAQKLGNVGELTEEAMAAFEGQASHDKMVTFWTLAAWLCGLVVLLGLTTIALTHKIAGPAYKMRRIFPLINGDNLRLWDKLRKGDELQEVFEDLADMLARLREHRRKDTTELESISELLSEGNRNDVAIEKLNAIIARYRESVKMT